MSIKQISSKIKIFSCPLVSDSQLCFLLLHSAFCSWDYTHHIFIFPSGHILCSEEHARGRLHVRKGEKDSLPFALWGFPLAVQPPGRETSAAPGLSSILTHDFSSTRKWKSLNRPDSLQPRGLYSPWNSPGQNTGVGSLSLLQQIFPTQELNWGLLHCRQILYQLSYWGSHLLFKFSILKRQTISKISGPLLYLTKIS